MHIHPQHIYSMYAYTHACMDMLKPTHTYIYVSTPTHMSPIIYIYINIYINIRTNIYLNHYTTIPKVHRVTDYQCLIRSM